MAIEKAELLQHALAGFEAQRAEIDRRIAEVRRALKGSAAGWPLDHDGGTSPAGVSLEPRAKRHLTSEARSRMAAAQRKRWAKVRQAKRK